MVPGLMLSLFPGIDLLGRAFEREGFCLVRGPDLLWGGDIKSFHPPPDTFAGVIGGPPCQAHSSLHYLVAARYGPEKVAQDLIPEFERCVTEAAPRWFLMECVPPAPPPAVASYQVTDLMLSPRWLGHEQSRRRRFSFGTRDGLRLDVSSDLVLLEDPTHEYAVTAGRGQCSGLKYDRGGIPRPKRQREKALAAGRRTLADVCRLQGLPEDFLPAGVFTRAGAQLVIGNGVHAAVGRAIARAVQRAITGETTA